MRIDVNIVSTCGVRIGRKGYVASTTFMYLTMKMLVGLGTVLRNFVLHLVTICKEFHIDDI